MLGSFSGVLQPGERMSRLVTELIASAAGQNGGFVFIRSTVPLFLTALFGTSDVRVLANVPPQLVPATFQPDAMLPHARVSPPINVLQPGAQTQFQVQNVPGVLKWTVNGDQGGNADVGLIDGSGLYTAPAAQPTRLPVTVAAEASGVMASASVDVIAPQTLLRGLGLVQSLSFLESLGRLFTAELTSLGGPSAGLVPSAAATSEIVDSTTDERSLLVRFEGENIQKIIPFMGRDGTELLVTYRSSLGCSGATNVFIVEEGADQVSLYIPAEDLLIAPWAPAKAPSDLILIPPSDLSPQASVLIEQEEMGSGGMSEVAAVDVSEIYAPRPENPPVSKMVSVSTRAPGPDLAVGIASAAAGANTQIDLFHRPGSNGTAILILTIDYDEDILQLADGTLAGSVVANLPDGVSLIAFHDPASTDRELGFLIIDSTAPIRPLPEGNLLELSFALDPSANGTADVRISIPGSQLIDLTAQVIALDEVSSGGVQIRP